MYFVHVLWNKYLVIFKFLCYLLIMNIIHWCMQYGVNGLFRYVSLFFLVCPWALFLYVFTSAWNLFICLIHVPRCFYFLYQLHFWSALHLFFFVKGGVQGLCDQHAVYACMSFIHIQQLTNFYKILFEFYVNGGCLRKHTNSVWNIAYKNRRLYLINFKCRQCMVCMYTLYSSQRENALSTTGNIYVIYIKFK